MIREALQYITGLKETSMKPEVLEINGKTYCTKDLHCYDQRTEIAESFKINTLSGMVDYIKGKPEELRESMILHIDSHRNIRLMSGLLKEKQREYLLVSAAIINEFNFDRWYDQERFLIELQANFVKTDELEVIAQVAGKVQAGTTTDYSDDGVSQKTTIKQGVERKDVLVPNPVALVPYRTFQEIEQPTSNFVFRIQEGDGEPHFKLVEAGNGIWKNEAMKSIKEYFERELGDLLEERNITIIA